jgi:hypothetical protein
MRMRKEEHTSLMEEVRNAYKILVGNSQRSIPLKRSRLRWKGDYNMDVKEAGRMG